MKILAIIPARGGSVRIPKKNIRNLSGRPLINWTIDFARRTTIFSDILVSTDSSEVAEIALKAGAWVPWLRPENLAKSGTKTAEVCLHALKWYETERGSVDCIVTLQPTSPFRSVDLLNSALRKFSESKGKSVISVRQDVMRLDWAMSSKMEGELVEIQGHPLIPRDLLASRLLLPSGSVYVTSSDTLKEKDSLIGETAVGVISKSKIEEIDIDTIKDFEFAEIVAKSITSGLLTGYNFPSQT